MVYDRALSPDEELDVLIKSLSRWLPKNTDQTVAVLVPDNMRGFGVTQALESAHLPFDDTLLRSEISRLTEAAAKALGTALAYITCPQFPQPPGEGMWIRSVVGRAERSNGGWRVVE